jgi:LuxR family maltose regulon positive regulatory protein
VSCAEQAASLIPAEEIAVRALNLTTLGNALTQYSFDPRAVEVLEGAALLARQAGQSHVYMMAAGGLAYALIISGSFRRAFEVCEEAVALAEAYQNKSGQKLTASASTYAFLSRVLMEWGEMEKAIQVARKGLALSELWGQADTIMVCLFYLAKVLSLAGDAEGTRQELARARKIALTVSPWHVLNVDVQELEAYLDLGALGSAETSRLIQQKAEAGVNVPAVIIARSLLLQDRPDDVLTLVESILPKLNQHGSYELVRCCALQALAAYRKKELPRAFAFLEQALAMAEPENRLATFVRDGAAMEKLLELALPRTSHPGFVRRVLAVFEARRKYQAEPAPHSEPLIEPLSARELDILGYLKGYLSAVEIASQLVVSVNTVRTHMKSIYGKLGVHGRSEAVRRAVELGLIQKQ